jgi:hypothetical protein
VGVGGSQTPRNPWIYMGKSMGLHGEIMDLHGYTLETWRCPVDHFYIPKTPTNIF